MRVVIDIDETLYNHFSKGSPTPLTVLESILISSIGGGKPLSEIFSKIRAEIAGTEYHFIDCEAMVSVESVYEIVEKVEGGCRNENN